MGKPNREDFKIRNGIALDASFFNKILDMLFDIEERLDKLELGVTDSDEPVNWDELYPSESPSQPNDNLDPSELQNQPNNNNEQGEQQ